MAGVLLWQHSLMAASCTSTKSKPTLGVYRPRRPQDTSLHKIVRENLETFLACAREECPDHDPIPKHVEKTFRKYLQCGVLCWGAGRCRCASCGHDFLVGFSCKGRGLCPSCSQKRMVLTAAHLVDYVLPRVAVRQWVLAVPKRIRAYLQHNPKIEGAVTRIMMRAVQTSVRRASPDAPKGSQFGAVTFSQRFGSTLNANNHVHSIVLDGVFSENENGEAKFFEATELGKEVVEKTGQQIRQRVLRYLKKQGVLEPHEAEDMLTWEHGGGFSLDASVKISGWDRDGLEKLARYCARPSFAEQRLSQTEKNQVLYVFPKPTVDGRLYAEMDPLVFLQKLSAIIPPPWVNLVKYFGVLAPNAKLRAKVVATAGPSEAVRKQLLEAARKMGLATDSIPGGPGPQDGTGSATAQGQDASAPPEEPKPQKKPKKKATLVWAMLIARVYEALPLTCIRCGGPMKIISFITAPDELTKVLTHLGEPTEPPVISPARGPPQHDLFDGAA